MTRLLPPLVFLFFLTSSVELLNFYGFWDRELIPPLSIVIKSFIENRNIFVEAWIETASISSISLIFSLLIGFSLSILFSTFQILNSAIYPLVIFLQTVPIIAIAPLLVIYLGYGPRTVQACAIFVSFFPIMANSLVGLSQIPQDLIDLFKVYNKSKKQEFFFLRIPYAIPFVLSGLKISSGLSVVGCVAGEFVAGGGLGALIDSSRTQQRIDFVFVCLFGLALIGLLQLYMIQFFEKLIDLWRPFRV